MAFIESLVLPPEKKGEQLNHGELVKNAIRTRITSLIETARLSENKERFSDPTRKRSLQLPLFAFDGADNIDVAGLLKGSYDFSPLEPSGEIQDWAFEAMRDFGFNDNETGVTEQTIDDKDGTGTGTAFWHSASDKLLYFKRTRKYFTDTDDTFEVNWKVCYKEKTDIPTP